MRSLFVVFIFVYVPVCAQEHYWTLEECIAHAYKHNIEIKTQELSTEEKRITISESKWSYAPDISASNSYSLSSGRVLDPTTYDFVEQQTVGGNSSSIGANMTIFGGLRKMYSLKRAKLDFQSSLLAVEKIRNDVRLNVTAYYLEILYAEEAVRNAEQVVADLKIQEEKIGKKVELHKVTTADLLQIQSQLADAENDMFTAYNSYDIARLNLCQLLEIDDYMSFYIKIPNVIEEICCEITHDSSAIIEAVQSMPEVKSAHIGIDLAHHDLQIARAAYWPTISLSAGYGSSFSNVRTKMFQNADGTYRYETYPFFEQYKDNASIYVSLSINIPIFSGLSTRKNVQRHKLAILDAKNALRKVEKQVTTTIMQAQIDAQTAWSRYLSAQKYVKYSKEALRQIERKYELGVATITDYNAAMTAMIKAQSQLLQAKYEYMFQSKILRYYL